MAKMGHWLDHSWIQLTDRRAVNRLFTFMPIKTELKPGSVVAYISTYLQFLRFAFLEGIIIQLHDYTMAKECVNQIGKTVSKEKEDRRMELREEDVESLVSSDDIMVIFFIFLFLEPKSRRSPKRNKTDE